MKERDYLLATSITRIRVATQTLTDLHPIIPEIPEAEWKHVHRCLDAWRARLEWALSPSGPDDEAELREFPKFGGDK